jgi:uncharacterized membrane protein
MKNKEAASLFLACLCLYAACVWVPCYIVYAAVARLSIGIERAGESSGASLERGIRLQREYIEADNRDVLQKLHGSQQQRD